MFATYKRIYSYLDLARPYNAPAMLLSFMVGYVFLANSIPLHNFAIGLVVLALLHSAWNIQNDIYDYEIDIVNGRKTALTRKLVTIQDAKQLVFILFFGSFALCYFVDHRMTALIFVLSLSLIGWAYNSPPFSFSRKPIASIISLGFCYATIPFLFGYALTHNAFTKEVIFFVIAFSIQRCTVSILKDYKDVVGDKKYQKQTFLLTYGYRRVAWFSIIGCAVSYFVMIAITLCVIQFSVLAITACVLLLVVAINNLLRRRLLFSNKDKTRLTRIFQKSFIGENYFNVLLTACLTL